MDYHLLTILFTTESEGESHSSADIGSPSQNCVTEDLCGAPDASGKEIINSINLKFRY